MEKFNIVFYRNIGTNRVSILSEYVFESADEQILCLLRDVLEGLKSSEIIFGDGQNLKWGTEITFRGKLASCYAHLSITAVNKKKYKHGSFGEVFFNNAESTLMAMEHLYLKIMLPYLHNKAEFK